MTEIKFVKTLRDCTHNKNLQDGKKPDMSFWTTKLIYDYIIEIDGVARARWAALVHKRGYELCYLNRGAIEKSKSWDRYIRINSQKEFESVTHQYLHLIPTPERYEEIQAQWAQEVEDEVRAKKEAERANRMRRKADEMFALISNLVEHGNPAEVYVTVAQFEQMRDIVQHVEKDPTDE